MKIKRILSVLLAGAMMLSLAACGGEETSSSSGEDATAEQKTIDGNVLDEEQYFNGYLSAEPTTLDSVVGNDTYSSSVLTNVMEPLTRLGEKDGQNVREGAGAESWESNEAGDVWTFHLRDNTWSDGQPVTAGQIGAAGAMTALLKDALDPNLVQTLEHNPAIIHGGPFANIAHGCNSAIATRLSLKLADYVVTEAGFGADLGAEKFLDIKCRYAGLHPAAVVLVATVRALKSHGGVAKPDLGKPNAEAVRAGSVNLARHIENLQGFGLPVCVAINAFPTDTAEEMDVIYDVCSKAGVPCALSEVFAKGGEGGKALAETVLSILDDSAEVQYTYELDAPLTDKIEAVATKIYRAGRVSYTAAAKKTLDELTALGYDKLPVCIAKTQYSFSDNAKLTGAPEGHTLNVREVRLSAGAGFVVVVCGSIMTMPGLPKHPAAMDIDVDVHGKITGLF